MSFKLSRFPLRAMALVFTGLMAAASSSAQAQGNYPDKTVRIVVGFSAGGTTDVVARILAKELTEELGQSFVVENKPGAGSNIGVESVVRAPADGYTLLIGTVGIHAINGALYEKLSYDPVKDFTPISFLASTPNVLVVNKKLGVNNLHELIELAKAKPDQLTFGSSGVGTSLHMSGELFKEMAGVQIRHIPYKGRAQSLPDLLSGRISMLFDNLSSSLALIKAGEVQALGVTTLKRSHAAPEIPTLAEQGLTGFEAVSWFSLMAPANLPPHIQKQLNQMVRHTLSNSEVKSRLLAGGLDPAPGSSKDLSKLIASEAAKWGRVVQQSGAKLE